MFSTRSRRPDQAATIAERAPVRQSPSEPGFFSRVASRFKTTAPSQPTAAVANDVVVLRPKPKPKLPRGRRPEITSSRPVQTQLKQPFDVECPNCSMQFVQDTVHDCVVEQDVERYRFTVGCPDQACDGTVTILTNKNETRVCPVWLHHKQYHPTKDKAVQELPRHQMDYKGIHKVQHASSDDCFEQVPPIMEYFDRFNALMKRDGPQTYLEELKLQGYSFNSKMKPKSAPQEPEEEPSDSVRGDLRDILLKRYDDDLCEKCPLYRQYLEISQAKAAEQDEVEGHPYARNNRRLSSEGILYPWLSEDALNNILP